MGELSGELKKRKFDRAEEGQEADNVSRIKVLKTKDTQIGDTDKENSRGTTGSVREEKKDTVNSTEVRTEETNRKQGKALENETSETETETETGKDKKIEKKEEKNDFSSESDQQKPRYVFGSTTAFGNMGGFKMFGSDKNVFSSSFKTEKQAGVGKDSQSAEKTGLRNDLSKAASAVVESGTKKYSTESNESGKEKEGKDNNSTGKKAAVFGSGSTFGNAFQAAINKKSVFEELAPRDTEKESDDVTEKDVYKKVHLEKQDVKSGEENEETVFQVKAKLYHMELSKMSLGWKERGFGIIKVNKFIKSPAENYTSRLVMRQNGNLKLILNLPIINGFQVLKGMPSSLTANKFIRLQVLEGGEPVQYAIKVGQPENATKLFGSIREQIPE
ncbi:hypothetical protein PMKS-004147 [Pichia membranifaciens]|uniref:RanBD1 domain-containing protein n=1 Tax=Pichia membranifaciens TaxID=4926 RepID=A0A1Q2YMC6_9ASCO|nr:hypothetical protein PMKS-004147 [Pichia membranifaciens]